MSIPAFEEIIEQNDQTAARAEHLAKLRELVGNVYPNRFERSALSGAEDTITSLIAYGPVADLAKEMADVKASLTEGQRPPAEVKDAINEKLKAFGSVRIAGRLTTPPRGNFVHLTDGRNKLQIYAKKGQFALIRNDAENTPDEENGWTAWGMIDHGDFVGVAGYLFMTNTGEVSVHVEKLQFLAKAMLPMPDKMHGIADPELQRRYRYADFIASTLQVEHDGLTTREVFERRAKLISGMRRFLDDAGFIEVETPMLTPKATGAAAKPFETHHNALDIPLYARVAPELYLKRLVVGGFEKVYELNRNFRNEGLSQRHNPEFTMLEFYIAYMDVNGMMDFAEKMIQEAVKKVNGGNLKVEIQTPIKLYVPHPGDEEMMREFTSAFHTEVIDFQSFRRISMVEAISEYVKKEYEFIQYKGKSFSREWFDDYELTDLLWSFAQKMFHDLLPHRDFVNEEIQKKVDEAGQKAWQDSVNEYPEKAVRFSKSHTQAGKEALVVETFDLMIEKRLVQPTFIIDYPKSISPLSKADPTNPAIAERFELFINGMEVANGFSELNDPREQYDRFVDQMAERGRGDEEAMVLDEDYIRALSYGMPPAAGIGIGIDRLVMLLTNKHSIRDVILFPHMRPENKD